MNTFSSKETVLLRVMSGSLSLEVRRVRGLFRRDFLGLGVFEGEREGVGLRWGRVLRRERLACSGLRGVGR